MAYSYGALLIFLIIRIQQNSQPPRIRTIFSGSMIC